MEDKINKLVSTAQQEENKASNSREVFLSLIADNPSDYSGFVFSEHEMKQVQRHLTRAAFGAASALPMTCKGVEKCPFSDSCLLVQMRKELPIGKPCFWESQLLNEWRRKYIMEYDIDPDCMTELALVSELSEIELLLYRVNLCMSKPENAELVQMDITGTDREGMPLTKQSISAFFEIKEKLLKKRNATIKAMVGDRQEKYKREAALKLKNEQDISIRSATIHEEIRRAMNQATTNPPLLEAPLTPDAIISGNVIIDTENK